MAFANGVAPQTGSPIDLERDAVVNEQKAIVVSVVTVVADTVADIQQAAVRQRKRYARRQIAEEVLPAEPVDDDRNFRMHRLFIAENDTGLWTCPGVLSGIDAVRSCCKAWTVITALHFLTEVPIHQAEGIHRVCVIQRGVED